MTTALDEARDALERHDWTIARERSLEAVEAAPDDPAAHEALADAAWWNGQLDECIAARERAFALHEAAGVVCAAARLALTLRFDNLQRGREAVGNAWLGRARRLLDGAGECAEQGHLLLHEAEVNHHRGRIDEAAEQAERAASIGRTEGDRDLEALALQAVARMRIDQGRIAEGMALFDETMLSAVEGRLGPFVTGKVYCSLIGACEELGDLRRAAEWTEVGQRWAESHPFTCFPGLCRVHRAELLQQNGAWPEAEAEAQLACDELSLTHVPSAAAAHYEIGDIRRRLGDLDGAVAAFRRAEELGGGVQPGMALLQLSQGKVAAATAGVVQALSEQSWNRLTRAKLLPARVQIAIAGGDLDAAREAADELDAIARHYASDSISAAADVARGRVALADGDAAAAGPALRRGLQRWQGLDVPYEVATTRVLVAMACRLAGDEEGANACLESADAIFRRLGADLDTRAVAELREDDDAGAAPLPSGLTEREAEVLRLVATGATNKDIAAALFLSEKTVARHLSNIFTKIGVASRAAATAFAFENGLVEGRV